MISNKKKLPKKYHDQSLYPRVTDGYEKTLKSSFEDLLVEIATDTLNTL